MDAIYVNVSKNDQIYGKSMWPIGLGIRMYIFLPFIFIFLFISYLSSTYSGNS